MRLAKLVAAGLVLGAAVGFVGALLRPRPVPRSHAPDAGAVPSATDYAPPAPPAPPVQPEVDVRSTTSATDPAVAAGVR